MNHNVTIRNQIIRQPASNHSLLVCMLCYYLVLFVVTQTSASFHPHQYHPSTFVRCYQHNGATAIYTIAVNNDDNGVGSGTQGTYRTDDCPYRPRTGSLSTSQFNDNDPISTTRRKWMIGSILTGMTTSMTTTKTTTTAANAAAVTVTTASTATTTDLSQRLQTLDLQQPTIGKTTFSSVGNDMTTYPYYMEGIWDVTQTLINVETPVGIQYAGGPNGLLDIATKSIQESKSQIGKPIHLQLRYQQCQLKTTSSNTKNAPPQRRPPSVVVLEDRLFNTRQRLNQFAGTTVVANVQYADTQGSNRETMQDLYDCIPSSSTITTIGTNDVPLTTTLTYFKGPAAQKVFVLGHHDTNAIPNQMDDANVCSSTSSSSMTTLPSWTGYEYQRSIFALTNGSTAPPITTDTELIYQFTPIMDCTTTTSSSHNHRIHQIRGKLRIAGYLNPNDKYYFDVKNRAVTVQDYTLDMKRVISL
jgi:hypothetical protein